MPQSVSVTPPTSPVGLIADKRCDFARTLDLPLSHADVRALKSQLSNLLSAVCPATPTRSVGKPNHLTSSAPLRLEYRANAVNLAPQSLFPRRSLPINTDRHLLLLPYFASIQLARQSTADNAPASESISQSSAAPRRSVHTHVWRVPRRS